MKKFDGMVPPTFVFAEEGKNGLRGPAPSSVIAIGAAVGLTIWYAARHRDASIRPATIIPATRASVATLPNRTPFPPRVASPREADHAYQRNAAAPSEATITCARTRRWFASVAPAARTATPRTTPAAENTDAMVHGTVT